MTESSSPHQNDDAAAGIDRQQAAVRSDQTLRIGIVGTRGLSTLTGFRNNPATEVVAVCDLDEGRLTEVARRAGIRQQYRVFDDLLTSDVDAVVIGTPMQLHVPQAIAALEAGKHVLCEVTAGVTMDELYWLINTVERTGLTYMMAENYCYAPDMALMGELARSGVLGDIYYGEGEYLHNGTPLLLQDNGSRAWRSFWQMDKRGTFYPTHSLGPIMQCLPDDRIVEVSTFGTGRHHGLDLRQEDTTVTMCQLASGGLVRIRVDALSPRPHQMAYYQVQGTKGVVEFSRFPGEQPRIWLADADPELFGTAPHHQWQPLQSMAEQLPERYRTATAEQRAGGHGGGDFFIVDDFVSTVRGEIANPIDVYKAAQWTAVALLSELSAGAGGRPVQVPHFRPNMPWAEQVSVFS